MQSGQPLTVTLPFDNPNVGEGAKLPNRVGDPNTGPETVEKFFNTDAFAVPAPYTFGNAGIGTVTGPGINSVDLSLVKNMTHHRSRPAAVPRRGVQRLQSPDHGRSR